MGLLPVDPSNPNDKPSAVLATIIPAREEWGDEILAFIKAFWAGKAIHAPGFPLVKFETSLTEAPHFHYADVWLDGRHHQGRFIRAMKKFLLKYKDDKPVGPDDRYDNGKQISFRVYRVPTKESINQNVLRGGDLVRHYLYNPTKEKSTDGKSFTLDLLSFDLGKYLEDSRHEAELLDSRDLQSSGYWMQSHQNRLKYVKKYVKYAATHSLPPLDNFVIDNQPNIEKLSIKYSQRIFWGLLSNSE